MEETMSSQNICAGIQNQHEMFLAKEILEIHGGALQCTDREISAKVRAMEWFCLNLESRGAGCWTDEEYLDSMMIL
jgi:hypothetical protein